MEYTEGQPVCLEQRNQTVHREVRVLFSGPWGLIGGIVISCFEVLLIHGEMHQS